MFDYSPNPPLSPLPLLGKGKWRRNWWFASGFYEHLGGKVKSEKFYEIKEPEFRRHENDYIWEYIEDLS
jgi:hypothetical protein